MSRAGGGGFFVTFEGPEGGGKSLQLQRLAARLEAIGRRVVATREPGGTGPGERIRAILLDAEPGGVELLGATEALLFCAARAELVSRVIRPELAGGAIVLCDRYTDSTLAYQGGGRGLERDALEGMNRLATGGLEPDLTLLLDLPPELGLSRRRSSGGAMSRLDAADLEFHTRVRGAFLALAGREPDRVRVIDAQPGAYEVADAIWSTVSRRLEPMPAAGAGGG